MAWKTTLLCIVPPPSGCGWQTTAAYSADGLPTFSNASNRPTGPFKKNDLMFACSVTIKGYQGKEAQKRCDAYH